jgi:hypothetical protein
MKNIVLLLLLALPGVQSCDNNDPVEEEVPEIIDEVTLVFKTDNGATTVSVSALDPDGDGPQDMVIDHPIDLALGKTYTLEVQLVNNMATPGSTAHDVSAQVAAEGTDHMIFFGWSEGLFTSPAGNGNIDNRADAVNYTGANGTDTNGLPLGLTTQWSAGDVAMSGEFRVLLKHLPGLKTTTSGSGVGETDVDVTFDVLVH